MHRLKTACWVSLLSATFCAADEQLETIFVSAPSLSAAEIRADRQPFTSQLIGLDTLERHAGNAFVEVLARRATSVSINSAQNNRLQPDLQYRGFTASPLLGLSQGIAVYQNGVRMNDEFGDTTNWDLIPTSAVYQAELLGGSNAIYGLNAIGGALGVKTRTGFNAPGGRVSATLGEYGNEEATIAFGGNNGRIGHYFAVESMNETGWRDFSQSEVNNAYGALSWSDEDTSADVFLSLADNTLRGNGPLPEALLAQNRNEVFTHPDISDNRYAQVSTSVRHQWSEQTELDLTLFYRHTEIAAFNGDGSEYEACEDLMLLLCDDDDPIRDSDGNPVPSYLNAINNRSARDQSSSGLTLQILSSQRMAARVHHFSIGIDAQFSETDFESSAEFAELTADRGTIGSNRFDPSAKTRLRSTVTSWGVFAGDAIEMSDALTIHTSVRYNVRELDGRDPSRDNPDLDGKHRFDNWNAGLGGVYDLWEHIQVYANLQTSSRTPTPVELACAHPDAPCRLPNSFLADPPLDDIRAISLEWGLRGESTYLRNWRIGTFLTHVNDDILFQATGGVSGNEGYFQNVADTRRLGLEAELSGETGSLEWSLSYSWLKATFEDGFVASSPNNPLANDGLLTVSDGDSIPGLPEHNLKLALGWQANRWLTLNADVRVESNRYLRGDEANVDDTIDGFTIIDASALVHLSTALRITLSVENVLDARYENFGLYGEADEVIPELDNDSGRFLGPGAPRTARLTVAYSW